MPYQNAKIYFDGGHYIAIPMENFPHGKGRRRARPKTPEPKTEETPKEQFEKAYSESRVLPKKEREQHITEKLKETFPDEGARQIFVKENLERKERNRIKRRVRLWRKINLQTWNYFCTFTYSDELHTEDTFKKKLLNTLKHLVVRKGWKYIGVWERGGETQRLHFHGIFYIPDGGIIGELKEVKDYSTKLHRVQTTYQNSHFRKHFGKNDFEHIITDMDTAQSVKYLLKYIEKTGERLAYGGKLPTYFRSDILDDDIACPCGIEDRKLLLFDQFTCVKEGEVIGEVSPEVIEQMPKSN